MAAGVIQSDGSYELKTNRDSGLDAGEYEVSVTSRKPGKVPSHGGPPMPGPYITPRSYAMPKSSGLKYTVETGHNEINIELSSKAK